MEKFDLLGLVSDRGFKEWVLQCLSAQNFRAISPVVELENGMICLEVGQVAPYFSLLRTCPVMVTHRVARIPLGGPGQKGYEGSKVLVREQKGQNPF